MSRRVHVIVGLALALLTVVGLGWSHRDVGYARDEGMYFQASRSYAAWIVHATRSPGEALERRTRDRHFSVNHEHPPLMKIAAGISALLLREKPAVDGGRAGVIAAMPEGAAMRLPAQVLAGVGVFLLFWLGRSIGGLTAGLLAAGGFILLPRVWFHAGLHAFDVPIAVAGLAVVLVYRRALRSARWGWALGPALGIAIAVKHNALFLGPLLVGHYWACLAWARFRHQLPVARARWFPLPLCSMAVLAPIVAWALWPWLWSDPIARFGDYLTFHAEHNWYNIEFLGVNYNQPPMPMSYALVMLWATVPTVLIALAAVGLWVALRRDRRAPTAETPGTFREPLPDEHGRLDGLLLAMMTLFPILLISSPTTPIFGGTKHFLTAYPFLALAAAVAWTGLWRSLPASRRLRQLKPAVLALCLAPSALATADGHPYNLSQYAPLVGGPRGAANLGLARGFWGHAVVQRLPDLEPGDRLYLHDLHELARKQYARERRWPKGVQAVPLSRANAGLIFHERHMATYEYALWDRMGSTAPAGMITLDDVPLTTLYRR